MKKYFTIILFLGIIYSFFFLNFLIKDTKISIEERRALKSFSEVTAFPLYSKEIFTAFEDYTLDQFPFRNFFRKLKANVEYHVFGKLDNNGIFINHGKIFKLEYPLIENNVIRFTEKINKIYQDHLEGMRVYYSIIPDKNYYLNDSHLKMDYDLLYDLVNENLSKLEYIEIRDLLTLNHYYDTDTHWKQNTLIPVAQRFEKTMTGKVQKHQYQLNIYDPFYGVYYGQAAIGGKGEDLIYLTNDTIKNAYTKNRADPSFHEVYKIDELGKMDSYNVFLSGSTPMIELFSKENQSGKELVIFRDSFASSLTPLLLESYSKITLIDFRYLPISKLNDVIKFENQDILFLYSTMIINQSVMLKD